MKTPAIIASLTVVGSIAYAAGSQGVVGKQSPGMPSGSQAHSMQEEMPQARMQQSPGCPEAQGQPLAWFGQVRDLPLCTFFLMDGASGGSQYVADVNGDGIQEFFNFGANTIFANGANTPETTVLVWKVAFNPADATEQVQKFPVLTVGTLAAWVSAQGGNWTEITVRWLGWFDADSDGDLDYGFEMRFDASTSTVLKRVWVENIGYEKPAPPVAADLNHDNRVDGADLSLLLCAWGQTQ
jgi:hypothetical protein